MEIIPIICINCGAMKNLVTQHKHAPQIVVVQFQADGWIYLHKNRGICATCPKGAQYYQSPEELPVYV